MLDPLIIILLIILIMLIGCTVYFMYYNKQVKVYDAVVVNKIVLSNDNSQCIQVDKDTKLCNYLVNINETGEKITIAYSNSSLEPGNDIVLYKVGDTYTPIDPRINDMFIYLIMGFCVTLILYLIYVSYQYYNKNKTMCILKEKITLPNVLKTKKAIEIVEMNADKINYNILPY